MSEQNVMAYQRQNLQVVREAYAALNRSDLDDALDAFHDNAEHDWSRSMGPYRDIYLGREKARNFWMSSFEAVEEMTFQIEETLVEGPHVVLMMSAQIRGRGSGAVAVGRSPHVWTLRDGKAARFQIFQTWAEALEAVGLSE